ncbi:MAG: flagellar biosynthesis anti-sigma factor FlgM [Candidatus Sericytochromatia bacterium]|nr:flagellar biosynthesis anti-sigma factor FlgM [Candidatus Sericytochromatia bacterium]
MKVPDQFSQKIARILGGQPAAGGKKATAAGGASFDQQFQRIAKAVQGDDAVRDAKVQSLKEQIANGTYHVSATDLADSLLSAAQAERPAAGGQSVTDLTDALFRQNL